MAALLAMAGGFHPHPNPLPSRERGSFDRLRTNGGGRAQDERRFTLTPTLSHRGRGGPSTGSGRTEVGGLRTNGGGRAQDERAGHPHPCPLPSRERGGPSTGSGRTEVSPSPHPLPSRERGSFDRLRTNGRVTLTLALSHRGRGGPSTGSGRTEGCHAAALLAMTGGGTRLPRYARNDRGRGLG